MKKIRYVLIYGFVAVFVFMFAYILLLRYPQPFFRYATSHNNIFLYSDKPFPENTKNIIEAVENRLKKSNIYNKNVKNKIFICGSHAKFVFFANINYKANGLNYLLLDRNIFLRPSNIPRNRLISRSGKEIFDDRTLVYYITHEIVHSLTENYLGLIAYSQLPVWIKEGYADYVGKDSLNFNEIKEKFKNTGNQKYFRYHLMVAFLLDTKKITTVQLLSDHFNSSIVEAESYKK